MKFSFMTFSCPELTLDQVLSMAKEFGYDGIEPRISANHQHSVEFETTVDQRREIRQKADDHGIAIACVATSCRYADPTNREEMIDDTHRAIDLTADIGSSRIRFFGGQLGEGVNREKGVELVATALAQVADHAADREVFLCMETHDDWCNPSDVADVMRAVNHPNIAVNWDIMHPVRRQFATISESFDILRPWIKHLHIHDGDSDNNLVPIGTGYIDHREAMKCLSTIDYDGYLSGEWISWSDPYRNHLKRELDTLKKYKVELGQI